jgi:hypothetical protein
MKRSVGTAARMVCSWSRSVMALTYPFGVALSTR